MPSIQQNNTLVIDIGGGSTKIVYGANNTIEYQQTFPTGTVVTKEKFQLTKKISTSEVVALQKKVKHLITKGFQY
ncbi:hypothetical protein D0962_24160 [Leptolyngbyaceae cyanobacterium CCMR0082]|uniref:Ppx/GppA phosphatase N-terminal domain-containing protein n=2 Tax=Adonisia turfae TaxID=2950184 RepID=A0A6M0SBI1_9CYAN|nr:hypothetical protein [Adonisia turfae CCMR0081]NEZ65814.1 hypothetical protein [Adonisia turfae CCMR0082]